MKHRTLGRTGLTVSEIGLGTEHLHEQPRDTVVSVIREAFDRGVTYFDVLFSFPEYLDNVGAALRDRRERIALALHIGCAEDDGQYRKSRDARECEANFADMLSRLGAHHADILFIQNVDGRDDYEAVTAPGGLLELAQRLRQDGKACFIGMSGHSVPMSMQAVQTGVLDVLMFPINPPADALPGEADLEALWDGQAPESPEALPAGVLPARRALYHACAQKNVGLVAMKPFAGGRLLRPQGPNQPALTPVQCLSYALSQPGVSVALPGAKSTDELEAALLYDDATDQQKDFAPLVAAASWAHKGSCVYCNHCLPCPSKIDVARTLRLVDGARQGISDALRRTYLALPAPASDCVECGQCVERCPFGVDVIEQMQQAVNLFETRA